MSQLSRHPTVTRRAVGVARTTASAAYHHHHNPSAAIRPSKDTDGSTPAQPTLHAVDMTALAPPPRMARPWSHAAAPIVFAAPSRTSHGLRHVSGRVTPGPPLLAARRAYGAPASTPYAEAVECDAYAYDVSLLHQPTIAGHALPAVASSSSSWSLSALPRTANVVVVRGFSVKNKLTPRMQSILKALIQAHVEEWEKNQPERGMVSSSGGTEGGRHDPSRKSHSDHSNSSPDSGSPAPDTHAATSATLPLVIASISNGTTRQAVRDQKRLDTFVARLGPLPVGAVFVCAMTEAQGKALGGPFAKPSRRVASSTGHPAHTTDEMEEAPTTTTTAAGEDNMYAEESDPAADVDPFLDVPDVDETAAKDLEAADKEEPMVPALGDPRDIYQEKEDVLNLVDDDAMMADAYEDARAQPFRQPDTDGVVLVDLLVEGVKPAELGNATHSAATHKKRLKKRKKGSLAAAAAAAATTTVEVNEPLLSTTTNTTTAPHDDAASSTVPVPSSLSSASSPAPPPLDGPCTTAQRFTGVKTAHLSDVLHTLLPPAANVLVIDRRPLWASETRDVDQATDDAPATREAQAHVESDVTESHDLDFGPRLVHPDAYALMSNTVCDATGLAATARLPTLLVFQSHFSAAEAATATAVLERALRDVRHVRGRLGGVFVVPGSTSDAALAALTRAARESQQRVAPGYRPVITANQDSPFSNFLARRGPVPVPEAVTPPAVTGQDRPTAQAPEEVETEKEEEAVPVDTPAASPTTVLGSFGIKLPDLGFLGVGARKADVTSSAVDTTPTATTVVAEPVEKSSEAPAVTAPARARPRDDARLRRTPLGPDTARLASRAIMMKPHPADRAGPATVPDTASGAPVSAGYRAWIPRPNARMLDATAYQHTSARAAHVRPPHHRRVRQTHKSATGSVARHGQQKQARTSSARVSSRVADEHTDVDAAVDAIVRELMKEVPPSARGKAAESSHTGASHPPSRAKKPDLRETQTAASARTTGQHDAAPTTPKAPATPVDMDLFVKQIIADANAAAAAAAADAKTKTKGAPVVAQKSQVPARGIYAWKTVEHSPTPVTPVAAAKKRTPPPRRGAHRGGARRVHAPKKKQSKASLAAAARQRQQRSIARRRRRLQAAARVQAAREEATAPSTATATATAGAAVRGGGGGRGGRRGDHKKGRTITPAFALPSPENYQQRASKTELVALQRLIEPRVMPSATDLQAVPDALAARLARAVSVHPQIQCHGNTKEKLQILSWFPAERFKDVYRRTTSTARSAPSTVVLLAQRITSPKVFISQAHEDELVFRTVGAIVYACARSKAMHPRRRAPLGNGAILCIVFRNDLSLLACERQEATLEKVLHAVKGFERAKVFVTTPLPSTKKRVMT